MNDLTLVDPATASLPTNYEAACTALAECARVDECQEWADKMAALASYARQAKNEELASYCRRIQARAVRREGELLREIEPDKGGRPPKTQDGTVPSFTRTGAAAAAGLSERQRKTALRVANVPTREFEGAVESADPPSVTALAERGRSSRPEPLVDLGERSPEDFAAGTNQIGQPASKRPVTKPAVRKASGRPASLDRDTVIVGLARLIKSKPAEAVGDLVQILADEPGILALPLPKRIAIAHRCLGALRVRISDLQPFNGTGQVIAPEAAE